MNVLRHVYTVLNISFSANSHFCVICFCLSFSYQLLIHKAEKNVWNRAGCFISFVLFVDLIAADEINYFGFLHLWLIVSSFFAFCCCLLMTVVH
jgi:hypothetical protein